MENLEKFNDYEGNFRQIISHIPNLDYQSGELLLDNHNLTALAEEYSTPLYVYSQSLIKKAFDSLKKGFGDSMICYAVKANSNINILRLLAELGAGFDIVSEGELQRVLIAGGDPQKIVFSGVAKSDMEIRLALEKKIFCFNVESFSELKRINEISGQLHIKGPISIRINPDIDAQTHEYISTGLKKNKFGVSSEKVMEIYKTAAMLPNIIIKGIDCHIGSQICKIEPFVDSLRILVDFVDKLGQEGIVLEHIDIGGGIGIRYSDEKIVDVQEYAQKAKEIIGTRKINLILEPGRFLVGNAGILITKIVYLKENTGRNFALIDAGMNDLIRPSLYQAYHPIVPLKIQNRANITLNTYDIVGPVCETGDFLGKERSLMIAEGDYLCILAVGAYGSSMCSNYNTRPKPAEILLENSKTRRQIRRRETFESLIKDEM